MLTNEEIRRWNTRTLADRAGGVARFALLIDRAQAQVSHIIGKNPSKVIESKQARHIESSCSVATGWLDVPHVREWLSIHNTGLAETLRMELARQGVTVDAPSTLSGPEAEMMTLFALMPERAKGQILAIARILYAPEDQEPTDSTDAG